MPTHQKHVGFIFLPVTGASPIKEPYWFVSTVVAFTPLPIAHWQQYTVQELKSLPTTQGYTKHLFFYKEISLNWVFFGEYFHQLKTFDERPRSFFIFPFMMKRSFRVTPALTRYRTITNHLSIKALIYKANYIIFYINISHLF